MTIRRWAAFTFAVACALALAAPASAQWSSKQRIEFINDCLDSCRKNPRVPETQRAQCDDYCLCVVEGGQKLFNEAEFDQLLRDFSAGKQTPAIKQLTDLTPACNRRAFAR